MQCAAMTVEAKAPPSKPNMYAAISVALEEPYDTDEALLAAGVSFATVLANAIAHPYRDIDSASPIPPPESGVQRKADTCETMKP